jgi:hypothetical protein
MQVSFRILKSSIKISYLSIFTSREMLTLNTLNFSSESKVLMCAKALIMLAYYFFTKKVLIKIHKSILKQNYKKFTK